MKPKTDADGGGGLVYIDIYSAIIEEEDQHPPVGGRAESLPFPPCGCRCVLWYEKGLSLFVPNKKGRENYGHETEPPLPDADASYRPAQATERGGTGYRSMPHMPGSGASAAGIMGSEDFLALACSWRFSVSVRLSSWES